MLPSTSLSQQRQLLARSFLAIMSLNQRWLISKTRLILSSANSRYYHAIATTTTIPLTTVALFSSNTATTTAIYTNDNDDPKKIQQWKQLIIRRNNSVLSMTVLSQQETAASATSIIGTNSSRSSSTKTNASFQYPKAEELFHRIVQRCETKDDARALQRTVYELLGKPLRDFEFYIDGFGGKKSKHSSGGSSGSGAETTEPVKEVQKIFDVKLVAYDTSIKLKVIKEIRTILPGLGLKEAKELVESAPCTIQKGLQPDQAEAMKEKLTNVGAQIELV
jgi:ribosomal protein L7/L12